MTGDTSQSGGVDLPSNLNQLQSKEHEEILNVIDHLRSEGVSRYVDLPQLLVCGDQSSGKSSVLEAISGFEFPAKDNVCTRFATELILRRAPVAGVSISILPDPERPVKEQVRLRGFEATGLSLDRFAAIVQNAGTAMRVGDGERLFSKDVLRVEISGPTRPHLTLVDLPGLYHAADEQQGVHGVSFVESLVRSYMRNPRSVILAVISAKSDLALQKVTALTREIDPVGTRTLGIITKPDTLSEGSDLERSFHLLSQNKRVQFQLGWHVLKNRTYEERDISLEARRQSEAKFLSQGIWKSLPRTQVGIDTLLPRLSDVLKDRILSQMDGFVEDTQLSFQDTKIRLSKLGVPRDTTMERRRYLLQGSQKFNTLANNALNGIYVDSYFGDALEEGYKRRIRAVVQDRLSNFSDTMKVRGEYTPIIDNGAEHERGRKFIYRTEFIEEVRQRLRRNRGTELPGNFNSSIVGELFYQQTQPWEGIVLQCVDDLLHDIRGATVLMLGEAFDDHTVLALTKTVVNHQLQEIEDGFRVKTMELLEPQQTGHPITYNSQYVEIIQETRDRHLRDAIVKKLKVFFGDEFPKDTYTLNSYYFQMQGLIDSVSSRSETDMERFACSEAIDCMQAYYQVALRKFVDDFSNLAVEQRLLKPLAQVLSPVIVNDMEDDIVDGIAHEDESTQTERKRLNQKLEVLRNSLNRLQQLHRYSISALHSVHVERPSTTHDDINDGVTASSKASSPVSISISADATEELRPEAISTLSLDGANDQPIQSRPVFGKRKHRKSIIFEEGS